MKTVHSCRAQRYGRCCSGGFINIERPTLNLRYHLSPAVAAASSTSCCAMPLSELVAACGKREYQEKRQEALIIPSQSIVLIKIHMAWFFGFYSSPVTLYNSIIKLISLLRLISVNSYPFAPPGTRWRTLNRFLAKFFEFPFQFITD